MKGCLIKFFAILTVSFFAENFALACTDFKITAKDGSVVIARTLEFALDLKSNIMTSPQNTTFNTTLPDGKPSASWKSKYGYLFLDGLNSGLVMDGMNEKGLSFEYLYLPGETQYKTVPAGQESNAVPYMYFGAWVLGNFQSVDEVRQALTSIYVTPQNISQAPNFTFPLHAAIYDSTGKGIVVEFVGGQMKIHDNTVGIMTNSPTYDWHMTNLRNYLNLSPYAPNPLIVNGITFAVTGQGSGMVGLPGDYSPPSRFAKVAVLKEYALPTDNAAGALNLAQHIINNVDIAAGTVRAKEKNGKDSIETTQWTVFKDLTHKVFYYHTYNDLTLRAIDLNKIKFAENAPQLKMPIAGNPYVLDMTQQFLQKKN